MKTIAPITTKFAVIWLSPRGFANEGTYYYGTETEMEKIHEDYDQYQSRYSYISGHKTLEAAEAQAEKLAKRDRRETPKHEICSIVSQPMRHYFA